MSTVEQIVSNDDAKLEEIQVLSVEEIEEVSGGVGPNRMQVVTAQKVYNPVISGGSGKTFGF